MSDQDPKRQHSIERKKRKMETERENETLKKRLQESENINNELRAIIESLREEIRHMRQETKNQAENMKELTEAIKATRTSDEKRDRSRSPRENKPKTRGKTTSATRPTTDDAEPSTATQDIDMEIQEAEFVLPLRQIQKEQRAAKKIQKLEITKETTTEKKTAPKTRRPPPIIIKATKNFALIRREATIRNIGYQYTHNPRLGVKILTETPEDYRKMTKYLEERQETNWYTFKDPENKDKKTVIKGLSPDEDLEDIKRDITEQGVRVTRVTQLHSRYGERKKLSIYLVDFHKDDVEKMKSIEFILRARVRQEQTRKNDGPTQCYNCQGFHHGQSTCHMETKCVRCGEAHRATECRREKNTPATCANCQGEHPANYRGCPQVPKKKPEATKTRNAPPTAPRTQGISYANAAKKTAPQQQQHQQQQQQDIFEMMKLFSSHMEEMKNFFKSFKN